MLQMVAFFFMFVGVNSSRLCTASLAIALTLYKYKGESVVRYVCSGKMNYVSWSAEHCFYAYNPNRIMKQPTQAS